MPALPANVDRHAIIAEAIQQHSGGLSLRQIAETIGVSHVALRTWMLSEAPEQYRAAQSAALTQRIIEADETLESAADSITIARAREIAKFARWDAERRLPHLFGVKQDQTQASITVIVQRDAKPDRVVKIERAPQSLPGLLADSDEL